MFLNLAIFLIALTSCQKEPTANFTMSKTNAGIGEVINFTSTSTDADHYKWHFGDGTSAEGKTCSHVFNYEGNISVKLIAFSKNGKKKDEIQQSVTIKDTKLQIRVEDIDDPGYFVNGIPVELYHSYNDWWNLSNRFKVSNTDNNGYVTFSGCQAVSYFINIFDIDQYGNWFDNDALGQQNQNYIKTGTLTFGTTNYFHAYVIWDPNFKGYKIKRLEKVMTK